MPQSIEISVGARNSPLSKKQVEEVYQELIRFYPSVTFSPIYVDTIGDKDQTTSLRNLEKTDFFTHDIDQLQLKGACRISIHSAKDLPEPLPKGLVIAAITAGLDPSDSLVFSDKKPFPKNGLVGTSSKRREENVQQLFPKARFRDIRGTITQRLSLLSELDGVVIAEAALIRLGLTHLDRITLPDETASYQGRLAILAKMEDQQMLDLFATIHAP